ncbi:MAG: DUF2149 domain-containing protein [Methanosarcinaceae archaeon]|nr:DUF2149 domain-containing protein [Methanosarcinaceae archaeon]
MNSVGNVFDAAMVFSVALLVALAMSAGIPELLTNEDFTIVKDPGKENMQIIQRINDSIKILEISENQNISSGMGEVLGTAYKLEDGTVIYVPEEGEGLEDDPEPDKIT